MERKVIYPKGINISGGEMRNMASIWLLVCLILCVCLFIFIYFIKIYRIIEFKGFCPSKGIFIKCIFLMKYIGFILRV